MTDIKYPSICDWETRIICGDRHNEINFWLELANKYGSIILELGAGTGWITIPLIRNNFQVYALDNSHEMLNILKSSYLNSGCGGELHIIQANMRSFSLDTAIIDACLIPYSAFQYLLTANDQIKCLHSIHKHLKPHGIICLDLDNNILSPPDSMNFSKLYSEFNNDLQAQITMFTSWETELISEIRTWQDYYKIEFSDGRLYDFINDISLKSVSMQKLKSLLEVAGFSIIEILGDYYSHPYQRNSDRLIITAQKPYI